MRGAILVLLFLATIARAEVGDPTIETDHPVYPGEGAFQTVEKCVEWATTKKTSPQDKAIALYLWMLQHQFHLMSPQEATWPGLTPNTQKEQSDLIVYDANRSRFSYGYGLCGTVHAWNEPYWRALGMAARRRAFPGHTNSEIEYDGAWHAFDTDMAGLVFRKDGVVAGYEDIIKDPSLCDVDRSPLPRYPFAWPGDFDGMKAGWKDVARGGNWFKMYNAGYAAQPGIVHLRSGETFTRYFDRDHFGGPNERLFWHNMKGGPFRDWTFVNIPVVEHTGAKSASRGNASYCNGEFVYRPDFAGNKWREGVIDQSPNLVVGGASPRIRSSDGKPAFFTFNHFSPYVIAGRPADGSNPMTGPASNGFRIVGKAADKVAIDVSIDQGQTWKPVGDVSGEFEKDLTEFVKGRYGWQVRFTFQDKAGLDSLAFTTITQVAQPIYPRLKPGGSDVVYRSASRGVTAVSPNFALGDVPRFEEPKLRSPNMTYTGQGKGSRFAYAVQGNKPGWVVFRIDAPANLTEVVAAARYQVRVPPPEKTDFRLDVSTDGGKTWQPIAKADIPKDNEFSSGWMSGRASVAAAKTKNALIRVHVYQGGYQAGLLGAEFYGIYETPPPAPMKLTYAWKEGNTIKTHVEQVAAGASTHKFRVPTGKAIVDEYVRMEVP